MDEGTIQIHKMIIFLLERLEKGYKKDEVSISQDHETKGLELTIKLKKSVD